MADKIELKKVDDHSKRKRSEQSSTSELELSVIKEDISKKQKKKKHRINTTCNNDDDTESDTSYLLKQMKMINSKLENLDGSMKKVTEKLGNVITKGDGYLRESMKDLLLEMKDNFLESVIKNIEILECKLFEKEQENDKLKEKVVDLEEKIDRQEQEKTNLQEKLEKLDETHRKNANEAEQYSRRNNIRISGMLDFKRNESPLETAFKVIDLTRRHKLCNLHLHDIDIAHRLPNRNGKNRSIIVKLHSRFAKDEILRNVKNLKGTHIFINEDLTKLNQHVIMCIKNKSPDEVKNAWSKNGALFLRNNLDENVLVPFEDFQDWIDLPWPKHLKKLQEKFKY